MRFLHGTPLIVLVGLAVLAVLAAPARALQPGKAEGELSLNGKAVKLIHAYAVPGQKNTLTDTDDDVMVVLTDKPLPPDARPTAKPSEFGYSFAPGVQGIVLCIDRSREPSHLVVHHADGMYFRGYFKGSENKFKSKRLDKKGIEGTAYISEPYKTSKGFSYLYNVTFAADFPAK